MDIDKLKHHLKLRKYDLLTRRDEAQRNLGSMIDGVPSWGMFKTEQGHTKTTEAYAFVKGQVDGLEYAIQKLDEIIDTFFGDWAHDKEGWCPNDIYEWYKTLVAVPEMVQIVKQPIVFELKPPKEHEHL